MVNWSEKDCRQLIELWSEEKVQVMLTSSHRNISVFRELSENLNRFTESGQTFTAEQCRAKIKALQSEYRKARKANNKSGNGRIICRLEDLDNCIVRLVVRSKCR